MHIGLATSEAHSRQWSVASQAGLVLFGDCDGARKRIKHVATFLDRLVLTIVLVLIFRQLLRKSL